MSDYPKHPTKRLSSDEVKRMAAASVSGACVECARLQTSLEESRRELHTTHKRMADLEVQLRLVKKEVERLALKVITIVGGAP